MEGYVQKVTVIGLERYAMIRAANGIACDTCGKQVNFDRKECREELARLSSEGWTVPNSTVDTRTPTFCPDHATS